ncbi:MAG TPA: ABC transporter permease [Actinomycetota bacterium]|jgi:spermidine/putrescine transport system permease protein
MTRLILPAYVGLVMFYLVSPILVMILYSFNDTGPKKVSFRWLGFTAHWYAKVFAKPDLTTALKNSLIIASISTVIATILGTMIALALVRYRFRGKSTSEFIMFMNISAPEIVLGASLLSLFITFGVPRGLLTIVIAHVMFNIAYVAVTVRARLSGFDRSLEEAAQDLGASPWATFVRVTLPLIFPGILAGALLAFALSIDDFVITNFNAGTVQTFPLWVYGAVKVGIPPQVFVMGTLIFFSGVVLAAANLVLQRRKR